MSEDATLDRFLNAGGPDERGDPDAEDSPARETPTVTGRFVVDGATCPTCERTVRRLYGGRAETFRCRRCYPWSE